MDTQTLREIARSEIDMAASVAAMHAHDPNYWTLYADMDTGHLFWDEQISAHDQLFRRTVYDLKIVACVGTGDHPCNCEWCDPSCARSEGCNTDEPLKDEHDIACPRHPGNRIKDTGDIDTADDGSWQEMRDQLTATINKLPRGYFADEADDAQE